MNVTWSGAHPTNFINSDPNTSVAGSVEEYPMVLMQCRGVDDTSQPVDKQINPRTCWTEYDPERFNFSLTTAYPAVASRPACKFERSCAVREQANSAAGKLY